MIYIDQNKIIIKHYQELILFDEKKVEIKLLDKLVLIKGKGMNTLYLSKDEMHIKGTIEEIRLIDHD